MIHTMIALLVSMIWMVVLLFATANLQMHDSCLAACLLVFASSAVGLNIMVALVSTE